MVGTTFEFSLLLVGVHMPIKGQQALEFWDVVKALLFVVEMM